MAPAVVAGVEMHLLLISPFYANSGQQAWKLVLCRV